MSVGPTAIIEELVASVERYIIAEAWRFARSFQVDPQDLQQVGRLAAFHAAGKFDTTRGTKFLSFCSMTLRHTMKEAAQRASHIVHIPRARYWEAGVHTHSIDAPVSDDSSVTFAEFLRAEDSTEEVEFDNLALIHASLGRLPKPLQRVIQLRYFQGLTLRAAAEKMGVTYQRIAQLEKAALVKLRANKVLREIAA